MRNRRRIEFHVKDDVSQEELFGRMFNSIALVLIVAILGAGAMLCVSSLNQIERQYHQDARR
jgi:hypothetical protein